jgi:hypothetical protein
MKKLLIATVALVTVFAMPAPGALASPPRFRAIPAVSKNTEANPEHRQGQPTEQQDHSQSQVNDPYWNSSNGNASLKRASASVGHGRGTW